MKCPIPTNQTFNNLNNFIDMTKYTKICYEFNIDLNSDFRLKLEINDGAGYIYDENNKNLFEEYDSNKYSFEHPTGYKSVTMWGSTTYGTRSLGVSNFGGNWTTHTDFIAQVLMMVGPDLCDGFARTGFERNNDLSRTYIYCLLGAQVQTRISIIGQSGTSPDAQKQFIYFEDAIFANLSMPDSIERYQNAINNSHSKLDFSLGSGFYKIPSDLVMKICNLDNYNNNILIATDNMDFGINNIKSKLLLLPISKPDDLPVSNIIKNHNLLKIYDVVKANNLTKNNDSIYNDYQENKYILPLNVGGSIGLIIYL